MSGSYLLAKVAQMVSCTKAEGPGQRFAVWFQGCPLRCPGCCNPEMLPFEGGADVPIADIAAQFKEARNRLGVEGISLLGGEPFAHPEAAALASAAQDLDIGVMVYSGYTLAALRTMTEPHVHEILAHTDLLVDGPYIQELPETRRRWIGSTNQQLHFLTQRYDPGDPCWTRSNTLEIRMRDGELTVNGFPSRSAIGLWRHPKSAVS